MSNNRWDLIPNPEGPLPPLPDPLPPIPEPPYPELQPIEWPPIESNPVIERSQLRLIRSLRGGCYLIKLTSSTDSKSVADGTMRVEHHDGMVTASGDLYQRRTFRICLPPMPGPTRKCTTVLLPGPNPADGIPIFPRNRYRGYLRVTKILEHITFSNSFTLGFEMHRFDGGAKSWTNQGAYTAKMSWMTAPTGYPSPGNYLEGDVKDDKGIMVGRLTMGWVSSYLRRATVEIDRVSASEAPLNSGAGVDWRTIFDQIGWDVTAYESNTNVTEPSGAGWSDSELHQGMLTWRDSADLDSLWRFHLLCVRTLDSTERGLMYDAYGGDSNNIPREGAAISSHWVFPNADPWGKCKGLRFGTATAPYFRTAVHEIAHAMMMFHPSGIAGNHIMQITPQIADNAVPPVQFPDNIEWAFSTDDQRRLRHLPDVVVRPGTVLRFGQDVAPGYTGIPISPLDLAAENQDLEVNVSPVLETVPLGAPVRIDFQLLNYGSTSVPAPARLNMKSGHITGQVIDSSGAVRTFSTIVRYLDTIDLEKLEPGQSRGDSLTLLRGPDGPLFPSAGIHRVIVTLTWDDGGELIRVSGETSVMVTAPVDDDHAKAALKILSTPDTLVTMVVGGDHLADGVEAIQVGLKNPVMHPHFAYIEAKRVVQRFGKRKADWKAAAELITDATVMSLAEIKKTATLVKGEVSDSAPRKSITAALKSKAKVPHVDKEIKSIVDGL